jgi:fluoroacetyl-CoA thioesterase
MNCAECSVTVTENLTARAMGSGSLEVFATPALAALMEKAACLAMDAQLEDGIASVGVEMNLEHLAASPVGMTVSAQARLLESDGRRFVFEIEARDKQGLVGRARHTRATVKTEKFMERTLGRL